MNLFLAFMTALVLPFQLNDTPSVHVAVVTSDVSVVLQIKGLDDAALARLSKHIGRDKNANIEYACVASGVVVLRFVDAQVTERADVITMVRRQLAAAGIEQGVEFLNVHIEAKGPGKC